MADHNKIADTWVKFIKDSEGDKKIDTEYCAIQSRTHLLYLMSFTSQLIEVNKGIRWRLTALIVIFLLGLVGILRP